MRQYPLGFISLAIVIGAIVVFALAGLIGGPDFGRDVGAIFRLASERSSHPDLTMQAIVVTEVGGAPGMVTILVIVVGLLASLRRWRDAVALAGIVLGGRLAIELLKLAIHRPRPVFAPYPVEVSSLSFPSGHAGNSMITFLAIALVATPTKWRAVAVSGALIASLAIGATRPLLGVHWPSDVVGGWAFGIAWVVTLAALSRRWRDAAK